MTIELHLEAGDQDYKGTSYTRDRYIVLDKEGFDAVGEHMTKREAEDFIKCNSTERV